MKIAHVISSIDKYSGGTSVYMKLLLESLEGQVEQNLVTTISENSLEINGSLNLICLRKNKMNNKFKFLQTDLFHGNGLWQYPVHVMSKTAIKRKIPYIISTHGMLEPWALNQGKLKKKLAFKLFQYKDLAEATCIHATAPMEVISIRALGFKNPVAMIPNGINISEFPVKLPVKIKVQYNFKSQIEEKTEN